MIMFKVQVLNNISPIGLDKFVRDKYEVGHEVVHPDGILLRSHDMHDFNLPASVLAVARAGAGTNNIPIDVMSKQGIPVFNTPGANANAVKELVLTGMLLASRNILQGWQFAKALEGDTLNVHTLVESGKKQFVGFELAGRTLGVIGLGAIGVRVANMALALNMNVLGYDPKMTVERAWELSRDVKQAESIDEVLAHADFVTVHVPLVEATRKMINAQRLGTMKPESVLLNFARNGIVDDQALCDALNKKALKAYVTDFPSRELIDHQRVIALPHLGASTVEAEENCAVMAVNQLKDFLENGNIVNSVNFPKVKMSRGSDYRLAISNVNVPNMVGQISVCLANAGLNIIDMLNRSRGEVAYNLIDVDAPASDDVISKLKAIEGVLHVRLIEKG